MDTKICSSCKKSKSTEQFHWKNKAAGVLQRQCKECHKLVNAKHYKQNEDAYKKRAQDQRRHNKSWFVEYKLSLRCEHCGENHPATLDFHHKDPSIKDREVSSLIGRSGIDRIQDEISKCMVLCANCHRKLHYDQRNK